MAAQRRAFAEGTCTKCGRHVWLRQVATGSALNGREGQPCVEWCTRRGTKRGTLPCSAGGYHQADSFDAWCPHGCGRLDGGTGPDFEVCTKCGDEWAKDADLATWCPAGAFGRALDYARQAS